MKRLQLILFVIIEFSVTCHSQDIITLRTGEQIRSKVVEVAKSDIMYRKFDNQSGQVYVILKADVSGILYENGKKETFNPAGTNAETTKVTGGKKNNSAVNEAGLFPEPVQRRFLMGFSMVWPTGTWPATALTGSGTSSSLNKLGNKVKSFGMGVTLQQQISNHFILFLDMSGYNYNIFLARKGEDVQSDWTVEESAKHFDEPGAPQISYVQDLPSDVHFDMAATGLRLGAKYTMGTSRIRPWTGAGIGLYRWAVHYYNEDESQSYGKDSGYVPGLTLLFGIDIEIIAGIIITPFADFASPLATYKMEGLFYPQWDIEYTNHIMGTKRFGISFSFTPYNIKK
jgi:hypothetical protein